MTKDNASGAGMETTTDNIELPPGDIGPTDSKFGYSDSLVRKIVQAHNAKVERMEQALDIAKDALDHYQHGGSSYRAIAANALARIAALKP